MLAAVVDYGSYCWLSNSFRCVAFIDVIVFMLLLLRIDVIVYVLVVAVCVFLVDGIVVDNLWCCCSCC